MGNLLLTIKLGICTCHYNFVCVSLVACRASITMIRCGFASNDMGPTYFLMSGKQMNEAYSDEFLQKNGATPFSTIIMTPSGYLTDEAWIEIVPLLVQGACVTL